MAPLPAGHYTALVLAATALLSHSALAASATTSASASTIIPASTGNTTTSTNACGWNYFCPTSSPCCSEYGYCGSGGSCLGGCNPQGSAAAGYCAPVPVCEDVNYTFADTSRIQTNLTAFMGNASEYDWTVDHLDNTATPLIQNGNLALVLTEAGGGTRLSSTRAVLYGSITASIQTIGAIGVVTAFITMSGVKDEIDWEFTGSDLNQGQTNYYWEGDVANYTHGGVATTSNRATQFVTYGILWTPTQLEWTVNGAVVRTLTKASTLDPVVPDLYHYPQTPSRIQLSVWPAGIPSEAAGTISWAGGMIDWTQSAYTSQGYFAAYVEWINVQCYSASSLTYIPYNSTTNSTTSSRLAKRDNVINSYLWGTNNTAGEIAVMASDAPTIINSAQSTGMQMIVTNGGSSASSAASNWWTKLPLAAHIGIIIGGVAVFLILLITTCTCYARRQDKKKYAAVASTSASLAAAKSGGRTPSADDIPLVDQKGRAYSREKPTSGGAGDSWTAQQNLAYGAGVGKNGDRRRQQQQDGYYPSSPIRLQQPQSTSPPPSLPAAYNNPYAQPQQWTPANNRMSSPAYGQQQQQSYAQGMGYGQGGYGQQQTGYTGAQQQQGYGYGRY